MRKIYLDANILIHIIEGHISQRGNLNALTDAFDRKVIRGITSELSIAEVMVKPLAAGANPAFRLQYEALMMANPELLLEPVDRATLFRSAELRASLGGKLADSIHVATAERAGCSYFLTEDDRVKLPAALPRLRHSDVTSVAAQREEPE